MRDRRYIDYSSRRPVFKGMSPTEQTPAVQATQFISEAKVPFQPATPAPTHILTTQEKAVKEVIDDTRAEDIVMSNHAPKQVTPLKYRTLRTVLAAGMFIGLLGMGVISGFKAYSDNGTHRPVTPVLGAKSFDPENPLDVADDVMKYINEPSDGTDFDVSGLSSTTTGFQQ